MPNSKPTLTTNTIVIGASAAGLAVAACLKQRGIPFSLLEKTQHVASAWRKHYERLHLHSSKGLSTLPHLRFPASAEKYPSRRQVIEYLESYAAHFDLKPEFGKEVREARRTNGKWETHTQDQRYLSEHLVVATGYTRKPYQPTWPEQEKYRGEVLHSSQYKNGEPYRDKSVLVVGLGNSGGEIAIDLWERGARPALSVRSPVNILPRDLFGIPILGWGIVLDRLPSRLADALAAPILKLFVHDLSSFGLQKAKYGALTQIRQRGRIPLLDIGTVKLIEQKHLPIYPNIARFTSAGVIFTDGREKAFDAVVLATGYRPAIAEFLPQAAEVADSNGVPKVSGQETSIPGLYFCGFYVSPTGMLREIGIEAKRIARHIAQKNGV